jgi:23S rRNA (uracil1939-C5)-methyltransferase
VVFVPRVLPGEFVRVGITKKKKRYWEAEPIEIIERSHERVQPLCSLFGLCPGCRYQHVSYDEELRIKDKQLSSFFERQVRAQVAKRISPIASPAPYRYRNRLSLHAADNRGTVLGYMAEDNETVLDVSTCPLGHEAIDKALNERRTDSLWTNSLNRGQEVLFRYTELDGVHVVRRYRLSRDFSRDTDLPIWITEQTILGPIRAPLTGFFQVNLEITNALLRRVSHLIAEIAPRTVVDLYSGVGLFAFVARKAGVERVFGVDTNGEAIEAARYNTAALGLEPIAFVTGSAANFPRQVSVGAEALSTLWIVDPPRRGLDPKVISLALETRPAHILYVSCAPDTLARDAVALISGGYSVDSVQLFDMFPRTPHFESVTHLKL